MGTRYIKNTINPVDLEIDGCDNTQYLLFTKSLAKHEAGELKLFHIPPWPLPGTSSR